MDAETDTKYKLNNLNKNDIGVNSLLVIPK